MSRLRAFFDSTAARARRGADLAGLWLATLLLQPILHTEHVLASNDLLPWAILTVSIAALLRGRRLGPGPHPQLRPRQVGLDRKLRRLLAAVVPVALLCWYRFGQSLGRGELVDIASALSSRELPTTLGLAWLGAGTVGSILVGGLALLGREDGRTAWRPVVAGQRRLFWGICAALGLASVVAGVVHGLALGDPDVPERSNLRWVPEAAMLGLAFLGAGLSLGRPQAVAQRRAAGRRDGSAGSVLDSALLYALLGPSIMLWLTLQLVELVSRHTIGYESAYVVSLHVCAWAAVIWRQPVPTAVDVLLHEVAPTGGKEVAPTESAAGFDAPPEGALRIDPLRTRPTRSIHPWRVPVLRARISDLDDPVRPLWRSRRPPPAHHLLGEAAFELDPETGHPQWEEITVRLGAGRDVTVIRDQDVQTRRMVVLRAFPSGSPTESGGVGRTYQWEADLPPDAVQVVDAATRTLRLRDGDLIVVSSEGVARAFRVELGAPVGDDNGPMSPRLPQLEDYSAT